MGANAQVTHKVTNLGHTQEKLVEVWALTSEYGARCRLSMDGVMEMLCLRARRRYSDTGKRVGTGVGFQFSVDDRVDVRHEQEGARSFYNSAASGGLSGADMENRQLYLAKQFNGPLSFTFLMICFTMKATNAAAAHDRLSSRLAAAFPSSDASVETLN
uniref:Uncharacterized protein n=1 Tax=Timema cristinae TaxID=61476 RepID=A0A7R9C9W3_TIMCR|nr:unnamed protein product [Timema cristinae]